MLSFLTKLFRQKFLENVGHKNNDRQNTNCGGHEANVGGQMVCGGPGDNVRPKDENGKNKDIGGYEDGINAGFGEDNNHFRGEYMEKVSGGRRGDSTMDVTLCSFPE